MLGLTVCVDSFFAVPGAAWCEGPLRHASPFVDAAAPCNIFGWLQDPHPLDGAEELGAHCQGPALAAFVKQYFSVIQYDFMKRGYLCHAGLPLHPSQLNCQSSQRGMYRLNTCVDVWQNLQPMLW